MSNQKRGNNRENNNRNSFIQDQESDSSSSSENSEQQSSGSEKQQLFSDLDQQIQNSANPDGNNAVFNQMVMSAQQNDLIALQQQQSQASGDGRFKREMILASFGQNPNLTDLERQQQRMTMKEELKIGENPPQ